jgi:DNA-binding NtrC family response regulator
MACKILIVDDERDFLDTWKRVVNRLGYVCLTAGNVASALRRIEAERPDLVITDLHFPVGNGFEVMRHVQAKSPQTRVIIVTAYHTPAIQEAAATGAVDYLPKPFSVAALTASIIRALASPKPARA